MTITTPPQQTRTRSRRPADAAAPERRRAPAGRRDDEAEDGATGSARSGAAKTATKTTAKTTAKAGSRTPAPGRRRTRRPAPKRAPDKATKTTNPAKATKPTKPTKGADGTATKTRTAATSTSGRQVKVTVVRRAASPPRAPFVLLVVGLLGGALVSLLLLNTVLAQDAFTLSELQRGNQQLSERKQALQQDINRENSPAVLHAKARALGMVDGRRPAFIDARTGKVTEGGTRPPGVSDDAMAAAAGAGVAGAPGAIMPPTGSARPRTSQPATGTPRRQPGDAGTGGGTR